MHLLLKGFGSAGIAFAEEAKVHRQAFSGLQHSTDVEGAWCAGGGVGARCWPGAASHHGGDATGQGCFDLLWADEMNVRIDAAGREDVAFTGDRFGSWPHHDGHPFLGVGVACLPDSHDAAVLQADIRFDDAPPVENQGVGDHRVNGACGPGCLGLAHAVTNDFAAAEFHLIAVNGVVLLDLEDQFSVGESDPVACCGAIGLGVGLAGNAVGHESGVKRSVDLAVEAHHPTGSGKGNQVHIATVAWLEADGRSGRNVEALAPGGDAVEQQCGVGLGEVEMGTHLHGPVAAVGHMDGRHRATGVEFDRAGFGH